jgi:hypothetical protein
LSSPSLLILTIFFCKCNIKKSVTQVHREYTRETSKEKKKVQGNH